MKRIFSTTWAKYCLYLGLTGVWLSPMVRDIGGVPFQPGAEYSDLLISHLANSEFIHRAVLTWRAIPLWNPTILSGMPLAADPLSGLWYPPNWIAHLWPGPLAYNLLVWAHLAWLGLGMFLLARSEGLGAIAAGLCGGLAGGMPKLIGHVGLGHVGLVFAMTWTPWMLWGIRNSFSAWAVRNSRLLWAATAGGVLGLMGLIDPRWVPFAGILALWYALRLWGPWNREAWLRWKAVAASGLLGVFASSAIVAGLALPMLELTQLSTRASISPGERSVFSLSPLKLINLVLPEPGGYAEELVYFGAVALLLAALGLIARGRRLRFWVAMAGGALVFALGENTPVYGWISTWIPGMDLLRVPTRSLFLLGISLALIAAHGFDTWLQGDWRGGALRRARLAIAGLAMLCCSLSLAAAALTLPDGSIDQLVAPAIVALSATLLLLGTRGNGPSRWIWISFLVVTALELAWMGSTLIEMRSYPPESHAEIDLPETCLATPHGRLLSPSYSIPQLLAAKDSLELADGVNPLQLDSYRTYMSMAMGFRPSGYSVTLPPFPEGGPGADWHPELDVTTLARLNITCVIAAYPLQAEGLSSLGVESGRHLYRHSSPRPRAWIEDRLGTEAAEVSDIDWAPNRIEIRAEGPGRLILSEVSYPGWRARIDGEAAPIETAFGLFRTIDLPEGEHEVEFLFRPLTVFIGAVLTLVGGVLILAGWVRR